MGANPGLPNLDEEIRRFEFKVEAGAEYVVTQPVFDLSLLENFLKHVEHCRIPVVAGIWPLVSVRNAEFMKNELRVSVPDSILERMNKATSPEAAREEGIAIAREMLTAVRQMTQGAQISAPQGRYTSAVDVLEALGSSRHYFCLVLQQPSILFRLRKISLDNSSQIRHYNRAQEQLKIGEV